jgi:hypothetical protein
MFDLGLTSADQDPVTAHDVVRERKLQPWPSSIGRLRILAFTRPWISPSEYFNQMQMLHNLDEAMCRRIICIWVHLHVFIYDWFLDWPRAPIQMILQPSKKHSDCQSIKNQVINVLWIYQGTLEGLAWIYILGVRQWHKAVLLIRGMHNCSRNCSGDHQSR